MYSIAIIEPYAIDMILKKRELIVNDAIVIMIIVMYVCMYACMYVCIYIYSDFNDNNISNIMSHCCSIDRIVRAMYRCLADGHANESQVPS